MKKNYFQVLILCLAIISCLPEENLASPFIRLCMPGGTNCQYFNVGSPYYRCSTNSYNTVTFYAITPEFGIYCLGGTFQWYKMTWSYCIPCGSNCFRWGYCGYAISGATSSSYTVTEPGDYYCVYNCGSGDVHTDTIQVIYHDAAPTITSDPASVSQCEGQEATFSCAFTNSSSSIWSQRAPGGDWSGISGENDPSLLVLAGAGNDLYQYRCTVSNTCGSSYSDPATLDVLLKPYNLAGPQESSICEDATANFNASAQGDGLNYQWGVSSDGTNYSDLSEQSPYSGTQTKNLVINPAGENLNGYRYRCRISNTCAAETTAGAKLNLDFKPEIGKHPMGAEACEGEDVTFAVEVTGTAPIQYRWRKNNIVLGDWTEESSYAIHSAAPGDGGNYDVLVKNICLASGMESEDAQLMVHPTPAVSLGEDRHLCEGDSLEISAGEGYKSYHWSTGEESSSIRVSRQGNYKVAVTDEEGCTNSDSIFVYMDPALQDINLGPDRSYCPEETIILHAGSAFDHYEWSDGSGGQSISVVANGTYWLTVSNDNSVCIATDTVTITITEPYDKERLCIVTVDMESGKNLLIWEKTRDVGILSYNLWRETSIGVYEPIAKSIPFDDQSIFRDTTVSPENRSYLYKLSVTDVCGNESDLADVPYHKPIFLKFLPSEQGVSLTWTDYEIQGVSNLGDILSSYDIYRGTESKGLEYYTTVGSINDYLDTDPATRETKFYYRVAGVLSAPCYPSAARKSTGDAFISTMSNLEYNRTVGMEENMHHELLLIYPNPFRDYTTIRFDNPGQQEYRLVLSDISGKTVLIRDNIKEDQITLYRNDLKAGFYLIRLIGDQVYRSTLVVR